VNQELKNTDVENKGLTLSVLCSQLKWRPQVVALSNPILTPGSVSFH
jgi:hypothetical protein